MERVDACSPQSALRKDLSMSACREHREQHSDPRARGGGGSDCQHVTGLLLRCRKYKRPFPEEGLRQELAHTQAALCRRCSQQHRDFGC